MIFSRGILFGMTRQFNTIFSPNATNDDDDAKITYINFDSFFFYIVEQIFGPYQNNQINIHWLCSLHVSVSVFLDVAHSSTLSHTFTRRLYMTFFCASRTNTLWILFIAFHFDAFGYVVKYSPTILCGPGHSPISQNRKTTKFIISISDRKRTHWNGLQERKRRPKDESRLPIFLSFFCTFIRAKLLVLLISRTHVQRTQHTHARS